MLLQGSDDCIPQVEKPRKWWRVAVRPNQIQSTQVTGSCYAGNIQVEPITSMSMITNYPENPRLPPMQTSFKSLLSTRCALWLKSGKDCGYGKLRPQ